MRKLFACIVVLFLAGCHSPMYNPVCWDRVAPAGRGEIVSMFYDNYVAYGFGEME